MTIEQLILVVFVAGVAVWASARIASAAFFHEKFKYHQKLSQLFKGERE